VEDVDTGCARRHRLYMAASKSANERCCSPATPMKCSTRRRIFDGVACISSFSAIGLFCSELPLVNRALTPLFGLVPRCQRPPLVTEGGTGCTALVADFIESEFLSCVCVSSDDVCIRQVNTVLSDIAGHSRSLYQQPYCLLVVALSRQLHHGHGTLFHRKSRRTVDGNATNIAIQTEDLSVFFFLTLSVFFVQ